MKNKIIEDLFLKTIVNLYPFQKEINDNVTFQKYRHLNSFLNDYHSGRFNFSLQTEIDGFKVVHIGRDGCGVILVFNPKTVQQKNKITILKNSFKKLNNPLFSVKILLLEDIKKHLKPFSKKDFEKLPFSIPKLKLTKNQKEEVKLLLEQEGGPHSLIERLLFELSDFNKEYIISIIYYIPEIRFVSIENLNELSYRFQLRFNWELVKNKKNIG